MAVEQINDKPSMERVLRESGDKPVVFAFISYRCGHCRRYLPFIETLCQQMGDVVFKKVDVNTAKDLTSEFQIDGVPDTYLYKNGVLRNRVTGADNDSLVNGLQELRNRN